MLKGVFIKTVEYLERGSGIRSRRLISTGTANSLPAKPARGVFDSYDPAGVAAFRFFEFFSNTTNFIRLHKNLCL